MTEERFDLLVKFIALCFAIIFFPAFAAIPIYFWPPDFVSQVFVIVIFVVVLAADSFFGFLAACVALELWPKLWALIPERLVDYWDDLEVKARQRELLRAKEQYLLTFNTKPPG